MKKITLKIGKIFAIIVYILLYLLIYNILPASKNRLNEYNLDDFFPLRSTSLEYNISKSDEIYPQKEKFLSSLKISPLSSFKTYS
jgi:hypothetical protein